MSGPGGKDAGFPLREETLEDYEELRILSREAAVRLGAGDWSGFADLLAEKSRVIARIREAGAGGGVPDEALRARAERSLRALLEEEARALSMLTGLRDEVGRSLAEVGRGDAGLRSYRAGGDARVLDQRV